MTTPQDIKARYDYLDSIPLDGWIWEFVRRNAEYRATYADLQDLFPTAEITTDDTYFSPQDLTMRLLTTPKIVSRKLDLLEKRYGIKPNPWVNPASDSYLVKEVKGTEHYIGIPDPSKRYCDMEPRPKIKGSKPVVSARIKDNAIQELQRGDAEQFYRYCYKTINKISPSQDIQNTLYVGISLNAKKDDVKACLDELIDKYVVPLKVKARPEKWKHYLIVQDLRTAPEKKTYKEIADLLMGAYPHIDSVYDELNLQNYKKNAVALITSDYQKYMYL